jgi:hypothetical protein
MIRFLGTGTLQLLRYREYTQARYIVKPFMRRYTSVKVAFRSAWGAKGTATIRVAGRKLYWNVLDQTEGESWIPDKAVLIKRRGPSKTQSRECPAQLP